MGLRFQRRVKIFPGVTLNFSKSGVSTSLGVKGAHVTLGHGKTRATVGLPGSGLSHTTTSSKTTAEVGATTGGEAPNWVDMLAALALRTVLWVVFLVLLVAIAGALFF